MSHRHAAAPVQRHLDIEASELAFFGSDRLSFAGQPLRVDGRQLLIDRVADLGKGWWRLYLISPE